MQSPEIVLAALLPLSIGAAALYYQVTGTRRFESLIAFCGVALVTCGIAMARDGVEGSRKFLWMFPNPAPAAAAAAQGAGRFAADAPVSRSASIAD